MKIIINYVFTFVKIPYQSFIRHRYRFLLPLSAQLPANLNLIPVYCRYNTVFQNQDDE